VSRVKVFSLFVLFLVLSSCGGPQGCIPRFAELKTQYPHVLYHGPKKPSEVVLKKTPPRFWVSLASISRKAQGAVIVSEDWAFYQHPGYDEKQLKEAIHESLEEGKLSRGASTITQQVVKNIYLSKEKSISRKVRELWMATKVEKVLGKKRILELYFNVAEWGEGIFGIGQAAHFYFNKSASELSAKEAAFLAMLLPSPKKYGVSYRQHRLTPFARRSIRSIMGKMVQAGFLTPAERDIEWGKPLSFESIFDPALTEKDKAADDTGDEDVSDGVVDEAAERVNLDDSSLREGQEEELPSD
jgi:monofunctional biosynthetic peptidoglycan transglycosylase